MTKKKIFFLIVFIAALLISIYFYKSYSRIVPTDLLNEALTNTFEADSYSYKVVSTLYVEGNERKLTDINGSKDKEDNFHIKGSMLKQDVEIYQYGDTTYFKESDSDKWMVLEDSNIIEMEQFATEVNPLSSFKFEVPEEVEYLGKEEIEGDIFYTLSCSTDVENDIMEMHWKDFQYKFWIDKKDKFIRKAQVEARNKENENTSMLLIVELSDYNKVKKITPPDAGD